MPDLNRFQNKCNPPSPPPPKKKKQKKKQKKKNQLLQGKQLTFTYFSKHVPIYSDVYTTKSK